jgi:hypothetical protein
MANRKTRRPSRFRQLFLRPRLELLEDRIAPAVRTWTGGGSNDLWSNRDNWDGTVSVPTNGDDVVIPNTAGSAEAVFDGSVSGGTDEVTLNRLVSDEPFRIVHSTLTLDGPGPLVSHITLHRRDAGTR